MTRSRVRQPLERAGFSFRATMHDERPLACLGGSSGRDGLRPRSRFSVVWGQLARPATLGAGALGVVAVSLLALIVPARRASRANPADVLRRS